MATRNTISVPPLAGLILLIGAGLVGCESVSYDGVYEGVFGELPEPAEAEAVDMAFDKQNPDRQRVGLSWMAASDYGDAPEYLDAYRLFANSPDPGVRAAAAKALGSHGEVDDALVLTQLLTDPSDLVRWQAADALRKIHNPEAVPTLIERLDEQVEEDADTRAAIALALGQYPDRVVFSRLVTALNQGNYLVVNAAHRSLVTLTGHDAGLDPRAWAEWGGETADLFANRRPYRYDVYDPTLTYWDKYVTFWNNPDPRDRVPTGFEQAEQ